MKLSQTHVEEQKISSLTNGVGKTKYPHVEDWNQIPISPLYKKLTQSRSKSLRPETLNLLKEYIDKTL
jgi:hypothetical protein